MKTLTLRRLLAGTTLAAISLTGATVYAAETITLVVGASPGGTTDRVARGIATEMSELLDETVIVENKPGAGGNIAATDVARAPADGSKLLVSFTSFSVNASLYKKLPFDPIKDFTPISILAEVPSVLVVRKDFPANNVKELIAALKQKPGQYSFALGGIGSSLHMATANFQMVTKTEGINVPYKGTSPALQDLIGGQVDIMFASVENVRPLFGTDRVKFLGVTSETSLDQFPGVPPVQDTVDGFTSKAWFGMFGPAGMKPERLKQISDAVRKGATNARFVELMTHGGGKVITQSPEDFSEFVRKDIKHYAEVVKFTGASVD
jgi:tripartite-type tricarboxylate transporter receptor subunit TctC